ncbi:uncharacterized protein [Parasteatoda tepidariorum]|uniref:uncharacterized protein n=1 Tax=Parasteatoda tepidariorum TaxID=114398 RepID=UPI0039BD5CEC
MSADEKIKQLKRKRGSLRTSVTNTLTKLDAELSKTEDINVSVIEEIIETLTNKFDSLSSVDKELEPLFNDDEYQSEFEKTEEYQDKVVISKLRAKKKINEMQTSVKSMESENITLQRSINKTEINESAAEKVRIQLPKLSIAKFYGDVSQWLTFWNSFETAIHNNELLDKVDKFNYLKAHLGGSALNTVEGFSISNASYDSAIELLKDRFAKKDLLIHTHMSAILNMQPLKSSNDIRAFRKFYDNCMTHIRSLESLELKPENYGSVLCPMLLKILPPDLVLEYNKIENENVYSDIKELLNFLSKALSCRERSIQMSTVSDLGNKYQVDRRNPRHISRRHNEEINFSPSSRKLNIQSRENEKPKYTATDLLSSEMKQNRNKKSFCVFCEEPHDSASCKLAMSLSLEEKKNILKKRRACFRCLIMNHRADQCYSKIVCTFCSKRHASIMCYLNHDLKGNESDNSDNSNKLVESSVLTNNCCSNEVYLQTLIVYVHGQNSKHLVRIIIDLGSQRSYCSKFIAKTMGLNCIGEETVTHGLFGGIENTEQHKRYSVKLTSLDEKFSCEFDVMDQKQICAPIPKISDSNCKRELKGMGIFASDIELKGNSCLYEKNPNEIHILIGADLASTLLTGNIKHLSGGLVAANTRLGWTVLGKSVRENAFNTPQLLLTLHVDYAKISDLWELDSLGIHDMSEKQTKTETQEIVLKHFQETLTRDQSGRYQVCLPWLEGRVTLSDHKELAKKRLSNTVQSLNSSNMLKAYQDVFDEWEKEGIIEQVLSDHNNINNAESAEHFLPHRPVIKENSTTKIRPVFDGSAKTRNSLSLNECIEKGPNLIELIPSVLNRFRWGKIGVIADIRKAFLQISLQESDRNFLKFLWWRDGDPRKLITYRHCRVVFGVSCSPFLLAAVLNHHLENVPENLKHLAKKLKDSMYVDNCVASVDSVAELEYFRSESQKLLASAKFDLRGWIDNAHTSENKVEENLQVTNSENFKVPVLGLLWNFKNDTLSCDINDISIDDKSITKRKILSLAHKIFDPIGFTCPVTLIPKLLLQDCWKAQVSWDAELPKDIVQKFNNWRNQISDLKDIEIPRNYSCLDLNDAKLTLHVFCDASKLSYATGIFLRAERGNEVTCQLLQARSRVAPLKNVSIPRLELLACNIGVRLATSVKNDLNLKDIQTFYWSDSMDALYWIKKEGPWVVFVTNRVKEIRALSQVSEWNYVPGIQNPADLPSRGCSVKTLIKGKWWQGPPWLKDSRDRWPNYKLIPDEKVINSEKKKIVVSSLNKENDEYYHRISSYKRIIRITGWILRFFRNAKTPSDKRSGQLCAEELKKAELKILKKVQDEEFFGGTENQLKSLKIITDNDGLLRVKTKVFMRIDEEDFRLPLLLPSNHHVVKSLIISKHQELGHAGVPFLMTALRENYWILKSRRTIKKAIKICVVCQRFNSRPASIPEGPLPEDRVKEESVFEIIGLDVAGPLYLKERQKVWILLITCAIYRAVHLELLTALSTDNFLLALRRFISRSGRPSKIYSDNGTNFVGFEKLLRNVDLERLKGEIAPITWKFIPPSAPWWGGFWERLVGLMKQILRKVLGRTSLSYEEMATVLCECESSQFKTTYPCF